MSWDRRPEDETPRMEQRNIRDRRGRNWVGSVSSGTLHGGEDHTEVIFVCTDQPGELKRVARLDVPAAEGDRVWRELDDAGIRAALDRSEPA